LEQGDTVTVKIPSALAEKVKRRLSGSDFKTVDEYVAYVVEQVVAELEGGQPQEAKSGDNVFSKEDQASVEQRLRDLGYM